MPVKHVEIGPNRWKVEAEEGSEGVMGRWREPVMELKDRPVR